MLALGSAMRRPGVPAISRNEAIEAAKPMTTSEQKLASGPDWYVSDVLCTAGAGDRPFEEEHRSVCIAAVTSGSFRYRTSQGAAMRAATTGTANM